MDEQAVSSPSRAIQPGAQPEAKPEAQPRTPAETWAGAGIGAGTGAVAGQVESKLALRTDRRGSTHVEVGQLFDRPPPHNVHAERSLLGAMLLDPSGVIPDVLHTVSTPEHFYQERHGAIYRALIDLYDAKQSGDLVQIVELLKGRDVLEAVGGAGYLMDLVDACPSVVNAPHYARLVADSARLRKLIDAAATILHEAYHTGSTGPEMAKQVIDAAEQKVFAIAQEDVTAEPESLHELLLQEMERIDAAEGKHISGVATGFDDLDELTSGLQAGEMLILAARPSMGKTALALNLAEQIAFGGVTPWSPPSKANPVAIGVFSLEMSRAALTQRLLSARSGIDSHKLRTGAVGHDDWQKLQQACDELSRAPIVIDDTPGMSVLMLRARARRMKQKHDVRCVVIDYLQLLTAPGSARESRQVEVSEISRSIKALARELNIPVVCLAQLNRGAEQREGNRPRMSDLRESGSIEQDADVVMLLHREAYYHRGDPEWAEENPDKANLSEIIIAKQRNGPTGVVKLLWDSGTTRFKNFDHFHGGDSWGHEDFAAPSPPPAANEAAPFDAGERSPFDEPDESAPSHPRQAGSAFASRTKTGPPADHRDGGGPDDVDDLPF